MRGAKLLERLETYVVVTVITAVVWLYADSENIKPHPLPLTVKLVAPPGQALQISPSTPQKVQATVRCSQGQLAQLRELTREPIELDVTEDPDRPTQDILLQDRLMRVSAFVDMGVTVTDVEPLRLTATIESLVDVEADVHVVPPTDVQLAPNLTVEPLKVTMRMPRSVASLVAQPRVEARLNGANLAQFEENVPQTVEVPVAIPPGLAAGRINLTPATVRVTFTIRKLTETLTLANVPVLIVAPPLELRRFDVTLDVDQLFLRDVRISGPSDMIRRIRDNEIKVDAVLRLTADDLERGVESVPPSVTLPPGVIVESPLPRVRVNITRRGGS